MWHNATHPRLRYGRAHLPASLWLGFAFAVGLAGSSADGSLVVSGLPDFSGTLHTASDADTELGSNRLSSDAASDRDREQPPPRPERELRRLTTTLGNTSSTGSTSTTSSAGSGGSASSLALLPKAAELAPSDELTAWLAGEHRLLLPDPPGNELLRPPQAS